MSAVTYATAQILRVLPRQRIGQAIGRLADSPWPAPVGRAIVGLYSRVYDIAFDECVDPRDAGGWPSFDAFFTRKLRDGRARDRPGPARRPQPGRRADRVDGPHRRGRHSSWSRGGATRSTSSRGTPTRRRRLLGGVGFVVYLSPRDYHRVHAPVSGQIRRIRSMPGDYFPVNAIGMRHVDNLFCRNRRVAIEIDADGGLGRVTVVMVVAMIVGRITAIGSDARRRPARRAHLRPAAARRPRRGARRLSPRARPRSCSWSRRAIAPRASGSCPKARSATGRRSSGSAATRRSATAARAGRMERRDERRAARRARTEWRGGRRRRSRRISTPTARPRAREPATRRQRRGAGGA